eukprot:3545347-Rhodomonas_salina.2
MTASCKVGEEDKEAHKRKNMQITCRAPKKSNVRLEALMRKSTLEPRMHQDVQQVVTGCWVLKLRVSAAFETKLEKGPGTYDDGLEAVVSWAP